MELPQVTLGELYSLLGERDVKIYQQQRALERFESMMKAPPEAPKDVTPKKDPFKKG
jgi:hypothetical protein